MSDEETVNEEDRPSGTEFLGPLFEIAVMSNQSEWRAAYDGVKPVIRAVQQMLEAAADAQEAEFENAVQTLYDAAAKWQLDLFGEKP